MPRPAPLWALLTNSCEGLVGENSAPSWPRPWPVKGEPGAASRRPSGSTTKLSISEVPVRVPMRWLPRELKNTSPTPEPSGTVTVERGIGVRLPIEMQAEAGVAAAAGARVRDIDETGRGDRDAHRLDPARRYRLADEHRHAVRGDAQDRDLVAAGVDGQQVPAVGWSPGSRLGRPGPSPARAPGGER